LTEARLSRKTRQTENGNLGTIVVSVTKTLTFRNVRLSRQLEVLDVHRIEHDFENIENLSELTENEDSISFFSKSR